MTPRTIRFNEKEHRYTDDSGNIYVSVTQRMQQYEPKFLAEDVARRVVRKFDSPYYGWTVDAVLVHWKKINKDSIDNGNTKHGYLEITTKKATGYNLVEGKYINDRIHTFAEVVEDPSYGKLDLNYFIDTGISTQYPKIFEVILELDKRGYYIYPELCVHDYGTLTCGLGDLIGYNPKKKWFAILDYKTYADKMMFEPGYFKKDINGNRTDTFIPKLETFLYPFEHIPHSKGHSCGMQVSMYEHLASLCGVECRALWIAHIRTINGIETETIIPLDPIWLLEDAKAMIHHYYTEYIEKSRKKQLKMFI